MFWRKKKFVLSKAWPIPILNIVLHVRKCLLLFGMTFSKINVFNSVIVQKICILLKKCNWFSCVWWQPGNVIIEKFECYILLFKMLKVMYFKIILILIFLKKHTFFLYTYIFFKHPHHFMYFFRFQRKCYSAILLFCIPMYKVITLKGLQRY